MWQNLAKKIENLTDRLTYNKMVDRLELRQKVYDILLSHYPHMSLETIVNLTYAQQLFYIEQLSRQQQREDEIEFRTVAEYENWLKSNGRS